MSQFTFLIDDTSPWLVYKPYANGAGNQTENGWVQFFTQNGFNAQDGEDGKGDSFHITSLPGASVSISFFGTDVAIVGTANATYTITIDGSLQPIGSPASNQLFATKGLSNGLHNITVVNSDTSGDDTRQLSFNFANVTSTTQSNSPLVENKISNQNASVISYAGTWTDALAPQVDGPYKMTKTVGSSAQFQFQGRAVAMNGMANFGWWNYLVHLDGQSFTRNASSHFITPDALLFFQDGLDETKTHTLNVTHISDGMNLALNSFSVFSSSANSVVGGSSPNNSSSGSNSTNTDPNGSSASSSKQDSGGGSNGGAIAGAVIAVLAAILIATGLFFWLRRRKRNGLPPFSRYPQQDSEKDSRSDGSDAYLNVGRTGNNTNETQNWGAFSNVTSTASAPGAGRGNTFGNGYPAMTTRSSALVPAPRSVSSTGGSDVAAGMASVSEDHRRNLPTPPPASNGPSLPPGFAFVSEKRRVLPNPPQSYQRREQQQQHQQQQYSNELASPSALSQDDRSAEHLDRIANLIVERLGTRFASPTSAGGGDHDDHLPPPQYDD